MNRTERLTREARFTKGATFISIIFAAGAIALLVASWTTSYLDQEAKVSTHTTIVQSNRDVGDFESTPAWRSAATAAGATTQDDPPIALFERLRKRWTPSSV